MKRTVGLAHNDEFRDSITGTCEIILYQEYFYSKLTIYKKDALLKICTYGTNKILRTGRFICLWHHLATTA